MTRVRRRRDGGWRVAATVVAVVGLHGERKKNGGMDLCGLCTVCE